MSKSIIKLRCIEKIRLKACRGGNLILNSVNLTGRVTKDIELRTTNNNIEVVNFNLAVEDYSHKNNQGKNSVCFFRCVGWRGIARTLHTYAKKGTLIGISGSLITSKYKNSDGKQETTVEILIDSLDLLASPRGGENSNNEKKTSSTVTDNDLPEAMSDMNTINGISSAKTDFSDQEDQEFESDLPY